MMIEWKKAQLKDIVIIRTGKLDSNAAVADGIYPFFTCNPTSLLIDRYAFDEDAILLAGNNANGIFHLNKCNGKFNAYQRTYVITVRSDTNLATTFFYYHLHILNSILTEHSLGTATKFLTKKILDDIWINLPPINEQHAIARILGTLDDKIELNRRMNETLEGIARALFRSWFIDFDPVRAKAEGRQPLGMDHETAAMFPDKFEDSELGEIPKGWKWGSLKDITSEIISGSRPKGGAVESGIPSVGAENILGIGRYNYSSEKFVPDEHFDLLKKKGAVVKSGDVLMYKDGAYIGRTSYFDFDFPHKHCCINEHVFILRSSLPNYQLFLYYWLNLDNIKQELSNLNSNSAQPGLTQSAVLTIPILIPPNEIVGRFFCIISPLIERLFENCHESRFLTHTRDLLLPKLISGDVRVDPSKFGFGPEGEKVGEV